MNRMKCFLLAVGIVCAAVSAKPQAAELPGVGAVEYGPMRITGAITDAQITESSGLAAGRAAGNEGMLWTHNDSGDIPRLFLLSERGTVKATYRVDVPFATDWEDMCSFELDGEPYLLVGDVGDNGHQRKRVTLWLIPEPEFEAERTSAFPQKIKPTRRIDVAYADGPWDCESVAFDPVRREVVLVTKVDPRRPPVGRAGVYVFALPDEATPPERVEPIVVERVAELSLRITTAADVSPDGLRCIVATYGDAWQYVRQPGESWAEALARPGTVVELGPRGQSEAIAFAADGQTIVLTAEGVGKPVWRVSPRETQ